MSISFKGKRSEINELKKELASVKLSERVEAIRKVIAAMTVGKDVSALFADVVNCIQTENLELKNWLVVLCMSSAKMLERRSLWSTWPSRLPW